MYLKKIILQGFKSFADKTVLEFEDGITAIVGPNGSGKSNILDALRWVMGEMSAKTLRGANMQQIIFAGTQSRKPLNFAEVSLVLDNRDRVFPIEFDELVVTRRVFRSGESVYMINNAACRLRDVQELFMDTGIGKGGYSMIGQGNVAQILSTKAEDRREFFEGAAGVSKFKHRKEEAQRKLDAANENLTRVNDIAAELESQIGPLENQSKKARKYYEYYDEFKGLDLGMSLITIERNARLLEESEKALLSVRGEMDELKEKGDETAARLESLYEGAKSKDEEKDEQNSRLRANEQACADIRSAIAVAENNIRNNTQSNARIEREIEAGRVRAEQMRAQIKEKKKNIEEAKRLSDELGASFAATSEKNSEQFALVNEQKERLAEIRTQLAEAKETAAAQKANIDGAEQMRSQFLQRRDAVAAEKNSAASDKAETLALIEENERIAKESGEKRDAMKRRTDEAEQGLARTRASLAELTQKRSELAVKYNSMTSKKRILEGMENEYEGYARSVKLVLKAQQLKNRAIYGALSGLIEVKSDYVTAIEIALGGALQNIVVASEEDAKAAIAYLRESRGGRATFLPVSSVKSRRLDGERQIMAERGAVSVAADLVGCDKLYRGIVENLLGRTLVCDSIDNGIAIAKKYGYKFRIVTVGGDVLNAGGAISGGSVNKQSGFLSRANEIKELTAAIAETSGVLSELAEKIKETEDEAANIENRQSSYLPLLREYENEVLLAQNTAEHLRQKLSASGETSRGIDEELAEIEKQLSASGETLARLIGEQRTSERRAGELETALSEAEDRLAGLESEKDAAQAAVMEETLRLRELAKDIEAEQIRIKSLEESIEATASEEEFKHEEQQRLEKENEALLAEINEGRERLAELAKNAQLIGEAISEIEREKENITAEQQSIQESNKDLSDRMLILQQEYSRAENKCERLGDERESTISRMWDDYELTPQTAKEHSREIDDEKEAKKRIGELRGKIKALGSVNVDAIEEYKAVKERYEFLSAQKADLETSRDNLNKVIASMQELMEDLFNKQFAEINKSFCKVFSELFGGGSGRLYLSEPDNVLESGIEIEAQLPGKALQNMSLYSGGERSMIATALLFAILAVKPTPFCVLDEIDAALDDVNVSRFATYLKNYLDDTQFIVITHRRGTMEAANMLYGVTMQEKGVTKMLSLAIDDVSDDMLK